MIDGNYIYADYEDICNLCFGEVKIGDSVFWYGKGFGVRHIKCFLKRETLLTNEEFDQISKW